MSVVIQALFDKYDTNRNGKLSKREFAQICYSLGRYFDPSEVDVAFALIDSDGSGEIDRDEFIVFWRTDDRFDKVRLDDAQLAKVQQMGDYFRYFDVDGSGALNYAEFALLGQHMVQSAGYDLDKIRFNTATLDRRGAGQVTFNEYLAHMISLGVLDGSDGARPLQA